MMKKKYDQIPGEWIQKKDGSWKRGRSRREWHEEYEQSNIDTVIILALLAAGFVAKVLGF